MDMLIPGFFGTIKLIIMCMFGLMLLFMVLIALPRSPLRDFVTQFLLWGVAIVNAVLVVSPIDLMPIPLFPDDLLYGGAGMTAAFAAVIQKIHHARQDSAMRTVHSTQREADILDSPAPKGAGLHASSATPIHTALVILCMTLPLASGTARAAESRLPDAACPDVTSAWHGTLDVKRQPGLSSRHCFDIRVPTGEVAVLRVKRLRGSTKTNLSVWGYERGLVQKSTGRTEERFVFGTVSDTEWHQVHLDHRGSGEVELHLYRVDVGAAIVRGLAWGVGQAMFEEAVNAVMYEICLAVASPSECRKPSEQQFREDMVSRGVTLSVSALQERSLAQMSVDMAMNEASIVARSVLGGGGGHTMTIVMAVASEVVGSIYAH